MYSQLGNHKEILPASAPFSHSLPYSSFGNPITVCKSGINMSIPNLQRFKNCLLDCFNRTRLGGECS